MKRFFKSLFLTLFILVILFFGSVIYFLVKSHIENPSDFINELKSHDKNITFLLMGVDSLNKNKEESTRSDTMMIANINLESGNVNIISVPRDTYAKIEGYKSKQKLNHSYKYGGAELTLSTINNLLGTNIKNYIKVNYDFVKAVVDTVGGIDVDVPIDMDYEDTWADPPLIIHIKKGPQTLNGENAIGFLRFRHGYAMQDLDRVKAQQQFVSAFMQKLKEPQTIIKAPLLFKAYDKYTESNIPFSKIVKIGLNVGKFSSDKIHTDTLPGEAGYKNKISYYFLNEKKTDELLKDIGLK